MFNDLLIGFCIFDNPSNILYNKTVFKQVDFMSQGDSVTGVEEFRNLGEIESEITQLAAHIHAATFRLLELIREFDLREGWKGPGLKSCAHWLNWKCGIALGAAREKVRVARALRDLPKISSAFRCGVISFSKVRAMTRAATPANEDYLLMIARHGTASHVERLIRQYRKVKRIEALEHENQRHAVRELNWHIDDDGSYVFRARLTPEQGERVVGALEAAMDEQDSELKGVSAETPEVPANQPASDPVAARRADALERIADGFLGNAKPVSGGDRCTINVHVTPDMLVAHGESSEAELESGARVSAETSRRLACDCGVVHWHERPDGSTLDVGRRTRSIPPAIRRALQKRDRGCCFPGCTAHKYTDAHHILHWSDGGETKLSNLVLLCRHHHRLVHEGGFGVCMDRHGPRFTDPAGQILEQGPETRFRGNVFSLQARNRRNGLEIDSETTVPLWAGERMDDGMAVEGLLQLE